MKGTIHLPEQAKLHGPLHKRNEYVGENCFKEMGLNYHGTTNIPHQITTNISIKNEIQSFLTVEEIEKIEKPQLKEVLTKLHSRKRSNHNYLFQIEPLLIQPKIENFIDMGAEKILLSRFFGDNYINKIQIHTSSKVFFQQNM